MPQDLRMNSAEREGKNQKKCVDVIFGWPWGCAALQARARSQRRWRCDGGATRHIRNVIALLPSSLPSFLPLILPSPSRLSLLRHLTASPLSRSLSLFSLRCLYSLARSRSAKVDPLEQLDLGKRATDTAWSNRSYLVARETFE